MLCDFILIHWLTTVFDYVVIAPAYEDINCLCAKKNRLCEKKMVVRGKKWLCAEKKMVVRGRKKLVVQVKSLLVQG